MSTLVITPIKIDRSSKKLLEYEAAFKKGFDKLSPEQKILVQKPTDSIPILTNALKSQTTFLGRLKSFIQRWK